MNEVVNGVTDVIPDTGEIQENVSAGTQFLQSITPELVSLGFRIIGAIIILLIGRKIIKMLLKWIEKGFERARLELSLKKFLSAFINAALHVLLVIFIANTLGVGTASIVTLLGSAALAVGLSLQGSLSNFAGSVVILLTRPFKVGDVINSSFGDGKVAVIGLVYTEIVTIDNRLISIPNGSLANSAVTNVTAHPERRLDIQVGVSYEADLKEANEIFREVYRSCPYVLSDKDIGSGVDALLDSSVSIYGYGWVKTSDYLAAKWWITEEVKKRYDEKGISIPFNQIDVHVIGDKAEV